MYDSLNMHSLESSLIDIMRAEQDPMKGETTYLLPLTVFNYHTYLVTDSLYNGESHCDCG
jgi:hypothetical protein